ncbi:leucine-rich repeat domain-containing protein [uncultured Alistipes sp.]|jgi:regulator of chromosome condensation, RCC1 (fragment)|uniref:leucine-rich repeat domain-containing protein n=1 Tax=Alistipes sp. TaxID=1872444 RepID=UPI00266C7854|nr:leucine-rich repeat domain-containing protein [uncultured Alistipes sp.]
MKKHVPFLLSALTLFAAAMTSCEKDNTDEPVEYAIAVTAGQGGSGEARSDGRAVTKAQEGAPITLAAISDDGYTFSRWIVESGSVELSDETAGLATFTMPAENISVRAEFVESELNIFNKITDPGFLYYCKEIGNFDTNHDGILSLEEAQRVTEINVNELYKLLGSRIGSMAGIEYFTSLTLLTCYGNSITELDVSHNTQLTYLHVGTNLLTKLDVTKNTKLTELYVSRNAITEIDLSKCPDLVKFQFDQCSELTTVDFSHNPGLSEVSGYQCPKITSLDFSNNPALVHLNCFDCKLTSLDFSHCKALETVNCFTNELTSIDVTQCKALTSLACQNNRLTSLDVSNNTALIDLMCYANRMTELDASTMGSPDDYSLGCGVQTSDGTTPQTLTLTLRDEQKPHWQYFMVPYEEMNANVELAGGTANLFESIPDPVFKAYCEQFDTNHDGILTQEEAAAANEIIVPDMGIASLEGLDYFSGITRLVCNNNQLTTLCTAYNPLLVELVCNDNQLTELLLTKGISGGDELTTLSCQNNQLSKLSVAGCKKLTTVNCQNNLLTDLNTHWAYALSRVNCSNNKLTGLSFYQVDEIAILNCSNNELTSLSVAGKKLLTSLMCSDNPMTSLDISGCTSLVGVMAYANRLTELDASDMANPETFNLFCGNQTSDGTTAQTLTLTLREEQKAHWNASMKDSSMNTGVVLAD